MEERVGAEAGSSLLQGPDQIGIGDGQEYHWGKVRLRPFCSGKRKEGTETAERAVSSARYG